MTEHMCRCFHDYPSILDFHGLALCAGDFALKEQGRRIESGSFRQSKIAGAKRQAMKI
jgi:hypothetical protein